ncbi:T9SS type A sorting domain-containing protein [Flavobacterium sp. LB2P84]|uniref:T9SS type A sorting domain-containing protein n=1 Tax=Flavobacterium yafengii TaxID=3041253 RepID=A0AAW6TL57_9FLAO|nr:T9SS type A sorting domain-containing protein [Flavobacterium yafengii]MDI5950322.1 T9SS type A sorting domain-containing protein [Flavobacterium yafengii]MDI6033768.1 T9SS type A sorting domain-containing protein [Flavobacterium yafengii]
MIKYIFVILFFALNAQGQKLHHQMLSAQGSRKVLKSGSLINQTIGQASVSGNFRKDNLIMKQGYQQMMFYGKGLLIVSESITTMTYPNPMSNHINFRFSSAIKGFIKVFFIDLTGRIVFYQEKKSVENVLTVDNVYLAEGKYLIKLIGENYSYTTKILKLK